MTLCNASETNTAREAHHDITVTLSFLISTIYTKSVHHFCSKHIQGNTTAKLPHDECDSLGVFCE